MKQALPPEPRGKSILSLSLNSTQASFPSLLLLGPHVALRVALLPYELRLFFCGGLLALLLLRLLFRHLGVLHLLRVVFKVFRVVELLHLRLRLVEHLVRGQVETARVRNHFLVQLVVPAHELFAVGRHHQPLVKLQLLLVVQRVGLPVGFLEVLHGLVFRQLPLNEDKLGAGGEERPLKALHFVVYVNRHVELGAVFVFVHGEIFHLLLVFRDLRLNHLLADLGSFRLPDLLLHLVVCGDVPVALSVLLRQHANLVVPDPRPLPKLPHVFLNCVVVLLVEDFFVSDAIVGDLSVGPFKQLLPIHLRLPLFRILLRHVFLVAVFFAVLEEVHLAPLSDSVFVL
mmetsp:Transcript_65307/g.112321  ORF Transcript_65307/g.112321 Transcript_65307/m.112321 type:complete len:343 (-) Transcript_65307:643-1671(-)